MKKLIVLSTLITATFSAQAAELYLYAGAGCCEPKKLRKITIKTTKNFKY